jgi:hypothetical protein
MKREFGTRRGKSISPHRRIGRGVLGVALAMLVSGSAIARVVPVANIDQLYEEINKVENAGTLLVLAKGSYKLDPTRPHCGRLELQRDMGIQGVVGDPNKVRIDASGLYPSSPPTAVCSGARTGAVRVGAGNNSVEWLKVSGAVGPSSAISTDLFADGPTKVRIAHVIAVASARGIDVRNSGPSLRSRQLEVELTGDVLTDNVEQPNNVPGQGLRIVNVGTNGASINVTLSDNVMANNTVGCLSANLNATLSSIRIQSVDNLFHDNGNGCVLLGGLSDGTAGPATQNSLTWEDQGSSFADNTGQLSSAAPVPGGLVAVGGQVSGGTQFASDNVLTINLLDSILADNKTYDINAFAAKVANGQLATGNALHLNLFGAAQAARVCLTQLSGNTLDGTGLPAQPCP